MTTLLVSPGPLIGRVHVPADKSITHRALLFGVIAEGVSRVRNYLDGGDCRATLSVVRQLGVLVEEPAPGEWRIHGRGLWGLCEPEVVLDCVNSGTTARLLAGLLAGQRFHSVITGSAQLRRRPMARVVEPLRQMGADIAGRQDGRLLPLSVRGRPLHGIEFAMPVASAQVKSCLLLAGLYADGLTVVREPGPARDHTERMLTAMGAPIVRRGSTLISEAPTTPLQPLDLTVPGDFSSAAFLLAAGACVPGSRVTVAEVGVNPTRRGLLDALIAMGAEVALDNWGESGGEPTGDLHVQPAPLRAITLEGDTIVTLIDELPVFAVIATQAHGVTVVRDAAELRVKETDRIATTVEELRKLGARIEATADGFIIEGPTPLRGARVHSHGDHRLAMALAVAGLMAEGVTAIEEAECIADSFPGFEQVLLRLGARVETTG
ncbi:MAG: 3-phosphoshikimate 1-carboxyvinyltransferase [Anaerolineae bacterium]|nr:3-phosphoshikimate 1-carboxyvinyltransferase [Anaerolineae bacterium]